MQPLAIQREVKAVQHVADDLSKGQRHDGQVIAPQPQHRYADQHTGDAREDAADHHCQDQLQQLAFDAEHRVQPGRCDNAGKRADAHEAGVAQAQLARNAHHQVQ